MLLEDQKKEEDPKAQEPLSASLKLNKSIDQTPKPEESKTVGKPIQLNNDLMISSESDSSVKEDVKKEQSVPPVLSHLKKKNSKRLFDNNAFIDSFGLISDDGFSGSRKSANFNEDINSPLAIAKKAYKKQKE